MSLLGKILAVLNVLAAVAFFYLATLDFGKRQEWAYATFRHDLGLNGLPIDENETDPEGYRIVDHISDATLKELSAQAGGEPLKKTQQEELDALKARLDAELGGLKDDARKARLAEILRPLKRSKADRDALADLSKLKLDALEADYNRTFELARAPLYDAASGQPRRETEDKRRAIAHLLFNHKLDDAWHQRVLTIVGLRAYAQAAERQADAYASMIPPIQQAMLKDRGDFEANHQRILKQINVLAEELENRQAVLLQQQRLSKQHDDQVKNRKANLEELQRQLEADRKKLQLALAEQARLEKALFEAQRRTRDAAHFNEQAEREIRTLESSKR